MKPKHYLLIGALAALALAGSCSSQRKLAAIKRGNPAASLVLGKDVYVPEVKEAKVLRDTLRIKDDDGRELLLMKAIRDEETGDMVATETLDAAKITARFRNIAERHGLFLVEDCAQSHGACFHGQMTGTFGDVGCFSFYPSKNRGAFGDAGGFAF